MPNECTDQKNKLLKPGRKFTIAEANAIVNHICDHCCIDTQERFHNTFFHEICPLLLIAEHVGNEGACMVFSGGSSRFDGSIYFRDERKAQKVEFTAAIDGHNDALRMELLEKHGDAPAFQKIQATGDKRNRIFGQNETDGGCTDDYDQGTLLPLLNTALVLKTNKAKTNHHYIGAWLGIVFDDWVSLRRETHKKKRFDPLCRQLLVDDPKRCAPFSRVFIIGISRQYLFDSCEIQGTGHQTTPLLTI